MFRLGKKFLSRDPPQNSKKLLWLHSRLFTSCVHTGGLSCPPAWTQEAYHLPHSHSNFLLFWGKIFFFPVWTCIKPNLVSKIFPFTGGGGPQQKFFSQSEHVSSQIWCQKFSPLLGGGVKNFSLYWGGPSTKIFFPSLNMYQAKSGVKKFSLYWGGGSLEKFFFLVWTCIKPNLVSKIFPFTGEGGPSTKFFFPSLHMYQAKSGVKKFSLYWGGWVPRQKFFFWFEHVSSQICCQNFFPFTETGYLPPPKSETGYPPPLKIWDRVTPQKSETWDPPPPVHGWIGYLPPKVNRQTFPSINITFPRTTYAGGNNVKVNVNYYSSSFSSLTFITLPEECPILTAT